MFMFAVWDRRFAAGGDEGILSRFAWRAKFHSPGMKFGRVLLPSVAQRFHALVLAPRGWFSDSPKTGGDEGILSRFAWRVKIHSPGMNFGRVLLLWVAQRFHALVRISLVGSFESRRTLVETRGFEPLTSCVQGRRSPN